MQTLKRIRLALIVLLMVVTMGTLLFHLIEGHDLVRSLYFTVVTMTTVGYGDIVPKTVPGMLFSVVTIFTGVGIFGLLVGSVTEFLVEGQIQRALGRRRVERDLANLRDHYIVCGFGRIGSIVCRELSESHVPFAVIDVNEDSIHQASEEGYLALIGDATDDDMLITAGIERARGVCAVLPSDADNVFITMTAREISRNLQIVTRGENLRTTRKLVRAGASRVISPHEIGGIRMANAILKPHVIDFIEAATRAGPSEINMGEVEIAEQSAFAGLSLIDSGIRQDYGVIVVAIRKLSGRMLFNPNPKSVIESGDVLITMGPEAHQQKLVDASR
ncbi:MAG: NAD-binding protein [Planctomycetota bacterium]